MDMIPGANSSWRAAGVVATVLGFVFPFGFITNAVLFPILFPATTNYLSFVVFAGYIDMLRFTEAHAQSPLVLKVYIGTLLSRQRPGHAWVLTKLLASFVLGHKAATTACFLGFLMIGQLIPASWRRRLPMQSVSYFPTVWMSNSIDYLAFVGIPLVLNSASAVARLAMAAIRHMPSETFSYASAPKLGDASEEIRLLRLERKLPFCQLSGTVVTASLETPPRYFATSHVWAHGPQDMRPIVLSGRVLHITGNLHDILTRCSSFYWSQLVWVDSICIDQRETGDSLAEKSMQVRVMKSIYEHAAHVLVCLGEGPCFHAFSLIGEL
ncbi:heterokaryon incompatibility protein-domain-containing protein [Podospora didyma]|uniref:Heterokaryon incompatibility protein-domain-containing protein n=1 Tax=Podospora didyma TaxID=330526 RepID=A0AAE0NQA1_9PEZI|nr:heterokaryon incompatibility protein-domain-containing protein [Podospora didyma]